MEKVVVGLSGGVDSSVAAAKLHHQGYQVEGVTLWLMQGKGQCCSEGLLDAARLCEYLGIPHHVVDSRELFQNQIVDYLVAGYATGTTPLPCSQCNRSVKFGPMLTYARSLGIETIATGHYARISFDPVANRYQLHRAVDCNKDQSYFLYDLTQEHLAHTLFPLGELTKTEARQIAAKFNLHTAEKPESQDLCLVEHHGSMQTFLDRHIPPRTGEIVNQQGQVLGTHEGVHHYTIGQRKGLGVAAPQPLYVIGLDVAMNRVIVGERDSAVQSECTVGRVNWVSQVAPTTPLPVEVQVRYRAQPVAATIVPLPDRGNGNSQPRVKLLFTDPQFGITPGQAAVWYRGDLLLGGGIIERFPAQPD